MLLVLAALLGECIQGTTNCLRCLEDEGCGFCRKGPKTGCLQVNKTEWEKCEDKDETRTKRCVEELGGDAKDSVRYAIGFTILGVAIVIDIIVRVCARRQVVDEYSHL